MRDQDESRPRGARGLYSGGKMAARKDLGLPAREIKILREIAAAVVQRKSARVQGLVALLSGAAFAIRSARLRSSHRSLAGSYTESRRADTSGKRRRTWASFFERPRRIRLCSSSMKRMLFSASGVT